MNPQQIQARITQLEGELNGPPPAGLAGAALAAWRGRRQREVAALQQQLANPPAPTTTTSTPAPGPTSPAPTQSWSGNSWLWLAIVALLVFIAVLAVNWPRPSSPAAHTPVRATQQRPAPPAPASTQLPTYRDCMAGFGERRELADGRCDHLPY